MRKFIFVLLACSLVLCGCSNKKQFKPDEQAIIAIDNTEDRYHIISMRDRIGETLIMIQRYVGDIPDGSEIIDVDKAPVDGLAE